MDKERVELIAGLRGLADFLETNPDVPAPWPTSFNVFVQSREQLQELTRQVGGTLKKHGDENFFYLRRAFGPVNYDINIHRDQVCERVVTGKRIEPARAEVTLPAEPEREVDVYEWRCADAVLEAK